MTRHRTSKKYGKRGGGLFDAIPSFGFGSDSASGTEITDPKEIINQSTKQIQDLLGKITDAVSKLPDMPKPVAAQAPDGQAVVQQAGGRRRRRTHRKRR
jgi:hypothetical protein